MTEGTSSGSEQSSSLVVRLRARRCRMSTEKGIRVAFAAGVALSSILTISPTAPALLGGASLRSSDAGSADGVSPWGWSAAPIPAPVGLIVDYGSSGAGPAQSGPEPYGNGVPVAVRTPLTDAQLLEEIPARVAASDNVDQPARRASPRKVATAEPSTGSAARVRKKAALRVSGCSQCTGQFVYTSSKRGNLFASLLSGDVFRRARLVRPGNRPIGVAQQREAPYLTVWSFRRT